MSHWRSLLDEAATAAAHADSGRLGSAAAGLRAAVAQAPTGDLTELAAVAAMHELPWVRAALLPALAARAPENQDVREVVGWLTHDYEDFVAFAAIDLAGRLRLTEVLADLFTIVGRASQRIDRHAGKPVGIGHAVVLRAITAIVGSDSPDDLASQERELFPEGLDPETYPARPTRDAAAAGSHTHAGMAPVTGGRVRGGPPPAFDPAALVFDWDDPVDLGECGDFWLDVLPVSNAEYDDFARGPAARDHRYCHPEEPKGKLHLRNTLLDPRSGPDHPVVGVDWFDAYAYARSQGKRLPTEVQWQRAAQGDDRRAYPWGDVFAPERTHCWSGAPVAGGLDGLRAWRRDLLALADSAPVVTTSPRGRPGGESPFGILDLSGGTWEWTASSYDGPLFSPVGAGRDPLDVIYDQRSYAVIKGGTWTSLPEQASVAFRGRDLALDRHFEIGFRCACDCPPGR